MAKYTVLPLECRANMLANFDLSIPPCTGALILSCLLSIVSVARKPPVHAPWLLYVTGVVGYQWYQAVTFYCLNLTVMAGSSSGSQDSEGEIYKIIGHGGGQRRDRGDTGGRELGTVESLHLGLDTLTIKWQVTWFFAFFACASQVFLDDLLVFWSDALVLILRMFEMDIWSRQVDCFLVFHV